MNYKSIETEYRGVRYRSRMEARWAVFMDVLGVVYFYEPEAYDLGFSSYLPDFFLPQQDCFIEIKNPIAPQEESNKISLLAAMTKKRCFRFTSPPILPDGKNHDAESAVCYFDDPFGAEDYHYLWCECPRCGMFDIQFDGRADRIRCACSKPGDRGHNPDSPTLVKAYRASKDWRFEPGASNL